jgi:hypothetical protein
MIAGTGGGISAAGAGKRAVQKNDILPHPSETSVMPKNEDELDRAQASRPAGGRAERIEYESATVASRLQDADTRSQCSVAVPAIGVPMPAQLYSGARATSDTRRREVSGGTPISPEPGCRPSWRSASRAGQTLLIIEAMKTFNDQGAQDGTVTNVVIER